MHFKPGEPVYASATRRAASMVSSAAVSASRSRPASADPISPISPGPAPGLARPRPSPEARTAASASSATRDTGSQSIPCAYVPHAARDPRHGSRRRDRLALHGADPRSRAHLDLAIGASDDLMIREPRRALRRGAALHVSGGVRADNPDGADSLDVDVSQEDLATLANVCANDGARLHAAAARGRRPHPAILPPHRDPLADRLRHMLRDDRPERHPRPPAFHLLVAAPMSSPFSGPPR